METDFNTKMAEAKSSLASYGVNGFQAIVWIFVGYYSYQIKLPAIFFLLPTVLLCCILILKFKLGEVAKSGVREWLEIFLVFCGMFAAVTMTFWPEKFPTPAENWFTLYMFIISGVAILINAGYLVADLARLGLYLAFYIIQLGFFLTDIAEFAAKGQFRKREIIWKIARN